MPLIVLVAASIEIAGLPREHTHTILFIVLVVALIHVARLVIKSLLPLSLAVLETIFELTYVDAEILPFVLALTFWFTQDIGARETVAIGKYISPLAMLEAILPLAFVPVSILPHVHTISSGL